MPRISAACCTRLPISTRSDRKSTRLNSSHLVSSYAVFCLKKKKDQESSSLSNKKKTEFNKQTFCQHHIQSSHSLSASVALYPCHLHLNHLLPALSPWPSIRRRLSPRCNVP